MADASGRVAVKEQVSELDALELQACRQIKIFDAWRGR
jgi:hypothetical protein